MQFKTQDGKLLHVEKEGNGPLLILVPGANGTGDIFAGAVKNLIEDFTVITFDRRGYGTTIVANPLPEDASKYNNRYRLMADAQDVLELADKFSPNVPVYLFGTSSGSIVAEQTFSDNPERFSKIAIHESPIMTVTKDYQNKYDAQIPLVIQAENGDFSKITNIFADMHISALDAQMMELTPEVAPNPEKIKSMLFWLKFEVLQYTGQTIDWHIFEKSNKKVILFNGTDSTGFMPQEINKAIGQTINVPITMIPGAHLGYAQKPAEFAMVLKETLKD